MSFPNTACFSGLSIMCLVSILRVSLVCPLCVLSQCCMCLWFVHSVSCLNIHCVSGLSILCPVPIMPVSLVCPFVSCLSNACVWFVHPLCLVSMLPVSGLSIHCLVSIMPMCLGCLICVLSQYCPYLWFVHYVSCLNNACVFGLSIK